MTLTAGGSPAATPVHQTTAPPGQGTRPTTLRFSHAGHKYYDGKQWMPSVTGILKRGGEDQDGLLRWHADETARAAIGEAAELSRIRRLQDDDAAFEWLRKAPDRKRDAATVNGSDLHDVADRMLSGEPLPDHLHDDVRAMAEHVVAFMNDYRVRVLYSEARLANRTMGYCGTTDQIGIVPQYGELPLYIDWKTSASMYRAPKFSHGKNAMQLGGYRGAEVMFWDDRTEADALAETAEVGLIVMIRPEGYKVYDYDLVRGWAQFVRAFEGHHWWRDADELAHGPVRPQRQPIPTPPAPVGGKETADSFPPLMKNIAGEELDACYDPKPSLVELDEREHLLGLLLAAESTDVLDGLWEAHSRTIWTDAHSSAAQQRWAELAK